MSTEPILEAREITKSFPGVLALDRVDLACARGEVHALVGENGAGKSTLMKILAGAYSPDSGTLVIKGERVKQFTPQHAQELGVGTIYQELSLLPHLTVAENIALGREKTTQWGMLDYPTMECEAARIVGQLDARIDVRALVERLSPARRQMVETAKALARQPDILIMDEPSSSLDKDELAQLFGVIRALRERGTAIVYISHRLEEIFQIADRVSVLKDGALVGTCLIGEIDRSGIIRMMVGHAIDETAARGHRPRGEPVLEVKGLTRFGAIDDINLALHQGEILGIAGLVGSGRTELVRAIFGAERIDSGAVLLRGKPLVSPSPHKAVDAGIALIPEDRKTEGLVLGHSLRANIALASLGRRQRFGIVDGMAERDAVSQSVGELSIQTPGLEQEVAYLSGGNQQKAVLAKWLLAGPGVILCDEPTRGIDIGAKSEIYCLLRQLADSGKAIIMISSEIPEVLQLSDRVLVMSRGRVTGELDAQDATEERILALAYQEADLDPEVDGRSLPVSGARSALRTAPSSGRLAASLAKIGSEKSVVFLLLALTILVGVFGSDRFLTTANLTNLLRQSVIPVFLGIGQTLVILSGGIDLSVSAIVTVTTVITAGFAAGANARLLPVAVFCLAIGVLIGVVNAVAIIRLRVPAIIATLGTMTLGQGLALIYTREPIGPVPPALRFAANGMVGPLPVCALFLALALVLGLILLYRTAYGWHLYAVGGDEAIARLSGISVERVRALAYLASGMLAAATGLYLTGRMGSGDPTVGPGLELDSITAVLLGGTVLGGGRGGLIGTIPAVLVLATLNNVFNQLAIDTWYQQIAKGGMIVLAVSIYPQKGWTRLS
jgi:ABC-type sugar transport system ATPase subunit/ribose/xylose/arabinose/galactoside ABC-type transport system permease subunit